MQYSYKILFMGKVPSIATGEKLYLDYKFFLILIEYMEVDQEISSAVVKFFCKLFMVYLTTKCSFSLFL